MNQIPYYLMVNDPLYDRLTTAKKILHNCYENIYYYGNSNTHDSDNDEQKYEVNQCKFIKTCPSVVFVINRLKDYFALDQDLKELNDINNRKHLLSHYHHIMDLHLGNIESGKKTKNFQYIYNKIKENSIHCNFSTCKPYKRNTRNRGRKIKQKEKDIDMHRLKDLELKYLIDLLDKIHVNFQHSSDIYNIEKVKKHLQNKPNSTSNEHNKFKTNIQNDLQFMDALKNKLATTITTKKWIKYIEQQEFDTDSIFYDTHEPDDEVQSNVFHYFGKNVTTFKFIKLFEKPPPVNYYYFGYRFYYWSYFKHNKMYVKPFYPSLKDEMLAMNYSDGLDMTLDDWKQVYLAAQKQLATPTLKNIKCTYPYDKLNKCYSEQFHYGLHPFAPLKIEHICALLFYTDYTKLSCNFSRSFREQYNTEPVKQIQKRNEKWANMAKYLRELVECYGNKICDAKEPIFYHGISYVIFTKFVANFFAPTSTTKQSIIAHSIFCNDNGLILKLEKEYYSGDLKYFNCSILSAYAEDERLFFGGQHKLQFARIKVLRENYRDTFYEKYIHSLANLNKIIIGKHPDNLQKDFQIIRKLFSSSKTKSRYINKCFDEFCLEKTEITFNMKVLHTHNCYSYFVDPSISVENLLSFSFISTIFKNVDLIQCESIDWCIRNKWIQIGKDFINGLKVELDKISSTKLKTIIIKTEYQTILKDSNSDVISFQSLTWNIKLSNDKKRLIATKL